MFCKWSIIQQSESGVRVLEGFSVPEVIQKNKIQGVEVKVLSLSLNGKCFEM